MRKLIAVLDLDDKIIAKCMKLNALEDESIETFVKQEISGWVETSGISLSDCAVVDSDIIRDCYLEYLTRWAIEQKDESRLKPSPEQYYQWQRRHERKSIGKSESREKPAAAVDSEPKPDSLKLFIGGLKHESGSDVLVVAKDIDEARMKTAYYYCMSDPSFVCVREAKHTKRRFGRSDDDDFMLNIYDF